MTRAQPSVVVPTRVLARAGALGLAALAATCGAASCTDAPVVLATIPPVEAGPPPVPTRCVADTDCPVSAICAKSACDAPAGMCVVLPADCPNDEGPVCGCDHLTYFNDCLRLRAGVEASTPGECPVGGNVYCDSTDPCPTGALCWRFVRPMHGSCPADPPGSCWILPNTCPVSTGTERWSACDPSGLCTDTCNAIASGQIYRPIPRCP